MSIFRALGYIIGRRSRYLFNSTVLKENPVDYSARAKVSRDTALYEARTVIHNLATIQQYLTSDDINEVLENLGFSPGDLGNAAGAMFRGHADVKKVFGVSVKSKRPGRNRSAIGVYESLSFGGPKEEVKEFIIRYNYGYNKGRNGQATTAVPPQ